MPMLTTKRVIVGTVIAITLTAVGGIYLRAKRAKDMAYPAQARQQGLPIPVRTAAVSANSVEHVIGATGVTVPFRTAAVQIASNRDLNIGSSVSDLRIKAVLVQEGDHVASGQTLFEMDNAILKQIDQQREAALLAAKASFERAEKLYAFGEKFRALDVSAAEDNMKYRADDLETRRHELAALEQLVTTRSVKDFDYFEGKAKFSQARYEMKQAEHRLQRARDAVHSGRLQDELEISRARTILHAAEVDAALAKRNLDQSRVSSPLDGLVDRVELVPGQVIALNSTVMHVHQVDPILVRVDLPQERMGEVVVGQTAEIVLDAFPGETFTGKVLRMSPAVNPQLRVMPVIVEIKNPELKIRPGISGFVRVRVTRPGITVPTLAVQQHEGKAVVFCVKEGRAKLREIGLGPTTETGMVEVRHGLAAGDEVVVFHNFYRQTDVLATQDAYLQDDDLVDTDWRRWARR